MSDYKVPQNVEAEDKLIGPFSFKQFIFLGVATAFGAAAWGLSQVAIPLLFIPVPFALFFLILALPLRKEQPMEVWLAAIISFLLKPKVRKWNPDGIESIVTITAVPKEEKSYGRGYSQNEVQQRLSYLANLVDSRGWSVRGVMNSDSAMQDDLYDEAQSLDDSLDDEGNLSKKIGSLLIQRDIDRRQKLAAQMTVERAPTTPIITDQSAPIIAPAEPTQSTQSTPEPDIMSPPYTPLAITRTEDGGVTLIVNPYPLMTQSIIQPLDEQRERKRPVSARQTETAPTHTPLTIEELIAATRQQDARKSFDGTDIATATAPPPKPTPSIIAPPQEPPAPQPPISPSPQANTPTIPPSAEPVSPAIIDLAHNHKNLSVQSLQREAHRINRINEQGKESGEVLITLR